MTATELVCKALALARKAPWIQHHYRYQQSNGSYAYCAAGYLHEVTIQEFGVNSSIGWGLCVKARNAVEKHLPAMPPGHGPALVRFNDTPGRTKEEILAAFKAACS